MRRQLEGSQAVAEAVARCRPEVISAYPISPQTHIVEGLSDLVRTGELAPSEAADIAKAVDIYVRALATQQFEERLAKLERGPAPAGAPANADA